MGRTRIESLGVLVAVHQLDHGHGRGIAIAEARLQDPRIAAVTVCIARAQGLEQLRHHGIVPDPGERKSAGMQIATLGQRDQPVGDAPQFLRLVQRRCDLLIRRKERVNGQYHRLVCKRGKKPSLEPVLSIQHVGTDFHGNLCISFADIPDLDIHKAEKRVCISSRPPYFFQIIHILSIFHIRGDNISQGSSLLGSSLCSLRKDLLPHE